MDIKELRIGNWVETYGTNGNPEKWVKIKVNVTHIITCSTSPNLFRPIKINVSCLKKFGFEKWTYGPFSKGNFHLEYYGNGNASVDFGFRTPFIELKYVHQLQNLYFALTGEELN